MKERTFIELQNLVFKSFGKRDFDEVHKLINEIEMEFPERIEKYCFWRACTFAYMGQRKKAISVLREALSKGVWWNPYTLTQDPDLKALLEMEEFQTIIKECQSVLEKQEHKKQSELYTYGNEFSKTGILSIHWRGSNVEDFAPFWLEGNDYFIGFPQSSQTYGFNSYCWDNHEQAVKEVKDSLYKFNQQFEMDNLIMAGASQGGKLSIEIAFSEDSIDMKGFIAVIPAIKEVEPIESLIKNTKKSNLRGCIITGDQDPFYEKTMELVEIFKQNGIECSIFVTEGLGHYFPDNFSQQLKKAVDFISKGEFNGN